MGLSSPAVGDLVNFNVYCMQPRLPFSSIMTIGVIKLTVMCVTNRRASGRNYALEYSLVMPVAGFCQSAMDTLTIQLVSMQSFYWVCVEAFFSYLNYLFML